MRLKSAKLRKVAPIFNLLPTLMNTIAFCVVYHFYLEDKRQTYALYLEDKKQMIELIKENIINVKEDFIAEKAASIVTDLLNNTPTSSTSIPASAVVAPYISEGTQQLLVNYVFYIAVGAGLLLALSYGSEMAIKFYVKSYAQMPTQYIAETIESKVANSSTQTAAEAIGHVHGLAPNYIIDLQVAEWIITYMPDVTMLQVKCLFLS